MNLPNTTYVITDGNLGILPSVRSIVSGVLLFNNNIADLTNFSATNRIVKFNSIKQVEATGIVSSVGNFQTEHYILKEYFRMGGVELNVYIAPVTAQTWDFSELISMMNFNNQIRQFLVYAPLAFSTTHIGTINTIMEQFLDEKRPSIGLYMADTGTLEFTDLADIRTGNDFMSAVIGQDLLNYPGVTLTGASLANGGAVLGALSASNVSVNVLSTGSTIRNYTNGSDMVQVGLRLNNGTTDDILFNIDNYEKVELDELFNNGYIFFRHSENTPGTFLSSDSNCSLNTSDYNSIALRRTMNEVIRLVDAEVFKLIGSRIVTVPGTGELSGGTKQVFQSAISRGLSLLVNLGDVIAYTSIINYNISTKKISIELNITPAFANEGIDITLAYQA